jgi:CrcB protein
MPRTHPLQHLEAVLIVGVGGFAGSNLRYFVQLFVPSPLIATAVVNILGCLALGFFLYEELYGGEITQTSRTILATGFIASFTTYSTFVIDAIVNAPLVAAAYVAGSYLLGFIAVIIGRESARWATDTARTSEVSE